MKLSPQQCSDLAQLMLNHLKKQNLVTFKVDESKVLERAKQILVAEYQREADLEIEVNKMLDNLERQHPGEFQRYKMYPILKQKLAKERKVIL